MAVRLQKTVIDATISAPLSPSSFVTFSTSPDLSSNLAYITGVFISYIGTDSIGSLVKRFALKKPGKKMVEINNQRKAFLDMLAWSEGTDNGRQKTRNHGYDVIVGGELFTDYSSHLANLSR